MAANSHPVEYYLILKKEDNAQISVNELPEIKALLGALMSMGNDRNAIFKLDLDEEYYIFNKRLNGAKLPLKGMADYYFEVSADKPENASLYIRVRIDLAYICKRISIVTADGADYRVQSLSSPLKKHLEKTLKRSRYQEDKTITQARIHPVDGRI